MAHGGRREGSGRKAWELTPERARVLEAMVMAGMTQDVMAKALGTKAETLRLKARDVLDKAMAIANAKVAFAAFGETFAGAQIIGGLIVLAGVVVAETSRRSGVAVTPGEFPQIRE